MLETLDLAMGIAKKILCRDLTLQIKPGEVWGILGANGCGKTTLLLTLAGLIPAKAGEIRLQGFPVSYINSKKLAQTRGILFQDSHPVFPQTVTEFCMSGRFPHLNHFGWETVHDKEIGYQALVDMDLVPLANQDIRYLSGGERRRLSIAALLAQAPLFYFLDEPTNHLDARYQIHVLNHFQKLAKLHSSSIVMSLHDINLAAHYCDHILMLLGNGNYLKGTTQQILTEKNLFHLYQQSFIKIFQDKKVFWLPQLTD